MLQANQRVGEFVLEERIGQTAYDESWRAHHHMWTDQLAMVKVPIDQVYVNNLKGEGVRVHRLVHSNIVRPLAFDPAAQPPYLIIEYVSGGSLRSRIAKKLSVTQTINILRQVLSALAFAHERGIVHGDIRPENILVEEAAAASDFAPEGSVKVTDFGIGIAATATVTGDASAKAQPQSNSLAYVAPEQRDGGTPPDAKSDIYSVGIVLFEMLTGERPSGAELPSELNDQVPAWLDDAFRKSYARRDRRFESVAQFLAALTSAGGGTMAYSRSTIPASGAIDFAPQPYSPLPAMAPPQDDQIAPRNDALSFRRDDDDRPVAPVAQDQPIDIKDEIEPQAIAPPEPEPEPTDELSDPLLSLDGEEPAEPAEEIRPKQPAAKQEEAPPPGPAIPNIAKVPSRADREAIYDELTKKQARAPADVGGIVRPWGDTRDLDQGETANIRLRLIKWANGIAGGTAELDDQVQVTGASSVPFGIVKFLIRTSGGQEPVRSHRLDHIGGSLVENNLRAEDYRLTTHLSADLLNEKLLEAIPDKQLRNVAVTMARTARREFVGRLLREDFMVFGANVIAVNYRFDGRDYRAFMTGNTLSVAAKEEPFTRIRQEPTKHAAMLLDTERAISGLRELRHALEMPQWETKANTILSAVRGKLSASYMAEARSVFQSFAWLESLEFSFKAGQLSPGSDDALSHAVLVRKRMRLMQMLPGSLIAVVFIGLAVLFNYDAGTPAKVLIPQIVYSPFFVAGIASFIATVWSNVVLGSRMLRTDFAFYQAMLLPLAIAFSIAIAKFTDPVRDVISGAFLAIVIAADVLIFKYFRQHLIRPVDPQGLVGDGATIAGKIETMLSTDWERIKDHYKEQQPLYSFTSVQAMANEVLANDQKSESQGSASEEQEPEEEPQPKKAAARKKSSSDDLQVDRLAEQMNARLNAAAKALAPTARALVTLIGEYETSVNNKQLGMMQGHAAKIEQRGKELGTKLGEFDRLCKTPMSMDSDEAKEMGVMWAERANHPDIQLLKTLAERAKTFREDAAESIGQLSEMKGEAREAVERLKNGLSD